MLHECSFSFKNTHRPSISTSTGTPSTHLCSTKSKPCQSHSSPIVLLAHLPSLSSSTITPSTHLCSTKSKPCQSCSSPIGSSGGDPIALGCWSAKYVATTLSMGVPGTTRLMMKAKGARLSLHKVCVGGGGVRGGTTLMSMGVPGTTRLMMKADGAWLSLHAGGEVGDWTMSRGAGDDNAHRPLS